MIETQGLRTWIEINSKALKNNYKVFRRLIGPKCLLMAVVKSNAYGHNLIDFSLALERFGVDWLGVDSIVEAESLRSAGLRKPILVLGYTLPSKIEVSIKKNISLTISDLETLKNLKKIKGGGQLKIHIKVDTGMHRQGFFHSEIPEVIKVLKLNKNIKFEGVYTHFSSAKDPADTQESIQQIEGFKKTTDLFEKAGFKGFIRHAGATAGALAFPESRLDMVRIGIGIYGLWPSKEIEDKFRNKIQLQPVLSWKTIVGQLKYLPKGSRIGYDLSEKLKHDSVVATLPIGYWHGFPRSLSSIGSVLVKGKKVKVLGRVSMDMICVDVTSVKNIKIGDEVTLVGKSDKSEVSIDDVAHLDGTTGYEIVTRLNPLIKRIIV